MDSPYVQQQNQIIGRIVGNVAKINKDIISLNSQLDDIITSNNDIDQFSKLWLQYIKNSETYLDTTNQDSF
ncbi:DASH complex subunit dad4 [Smittium mucronatum]|uniref:DASH complex subunit DAD4 n=1 Tax=Smittium mucronatum TaxID=133383 RepID=A0A1R0GWM9_9FUNG|nr:DASH complex subunit dad4 [Smittium mucronatum]